ncbi:DUF262 domain-containing protein [Phocaeicola vulgatus]|uniref:DUF262 domain-containing protein n=1 Tax=Phocaeicola vulgatus TaxID=821 RepID=UPI0039B43051
MDSLRKIEEELSYIDDSNMIPPADIVAFNELRSCADLFRMYDKKQLEIQPDFQRNVVWKASAQTRFIDSLIKQLPIPSICISLDYKTEKRIIIDGLQRISSIIKFLEDDTWRLSRISDIDCNLSGKTVSEIKQNNYKLFERVENAILPVTVLRCDFSNQNHMDYLFTIFHRLNTGGIKLNNQEIRNCIYNGNFNNLLKEIANSKEWSNIFGEPKEINRFDNEEIILRVFAFVEKKDQYTGNLAKFLNHFMSENRNIDTEKQDKYRRTMNTVLTVLEDKASKQNKEIIIEYGKTLKEGLLVGLIMKANSIVDMSPETFNSKLSLFNAAPEFNEDSLREGLSAKEKVQNRLNKAISIFE